MDDSDIPELDNLSLDSHRKDSSSTSAQLCGQRNGESTENISATSGKRIISGVSGSANKRVVLEESSDDDSSENEEDWEEPVELTAENVLCFFCDEKGSPEKVLHHITTLHYLDLKSWVQDRRLRTEDIICMINFLRIKKPGVSLFAKNGEITSENWSSDDFMKASFPGDHALVSALIWDWDEPDPEPELFPVPSDSRDIRELLSETDSGQGDVGTMKSVATDDARNASYFDSYSGFNIHCEMLKDTVRTESYRQAINGLVKDKIVLDVGCGSGVLSCFAAKAGAEMVFAIDKAAIINEAHEIARDNGVADKIRFIHGDLDQIRSLDEKVDVIVSEWMGYFLLFEGMLGSVLSARDRYLKSDGILKLEKIKKVDWMLFSNGLPTDLSHNMNLIIFHVRSVIPNTARLYLCAVSDQESWDACVGYWDNAYGLKFKCLKEHNLRSPAVEVAKAGTIVTNRVLLRGFDLMKCSAADTDFETEFEFIPTNTCSITAFVGYFDVGCRDTDGKQKVMFSTSPEDVPTHWAQSIFYLDQPFPVYTDTPVKVSAHIRKSVHDKRGLAVRFKMVDARNSQDPHSWQQSYEL